MTTGSVRCFAASWPDNVQLGVLGIVYSTLRQQAVQ